MYEELREALHGTDQQVLGSGRQVGDYGCAAGDGRTPRADSR